DSEIDFRPGSGPPRLPTKIVGKVLGIAPGVAVDVDDHGKRSVVSSQLSARRDEGTGQIRRSGVNMQLWPAHYPVLSTQYIVPLRTGRYAPEELFCACARRRGCLVDGQAD